MEYINLISGLSGIIKASEKKSAKEIDPWKVVKVSGKEYIVSADEVVDLGMEKEASQTVVEAQENPYHKFTIKIATNSIFKASELIDSLAKQSLLVKGETFLNEMDNSIVFNCEAIDKDSAKVFFLNKCADIVDGLGAEDIIVVDSPEEPKEDVAVEVHVLPKVNDTVSEVLISVDSGNLTDSGDSYTFSGTADEFGAFNNNLNKALVEKQREIDDSLPTEKIQGIVSKYFENAQAEEAAIPEGAVNEDNGGEGRPQPNYEQFTNKTETPDYIQPLPQGPRKYTSYKYDANYSGEVFWKRANSEEAFVLVVNDDKATAKVSEHLELLVKYASTLNQPYKIISDKSLKYVVADSVYQTEDTTEVKKPEDLGLTKSEIMPDAVESEGKRFLKKEVI